MNKKYKVVFEVYYELKSPQAIFSLSFSLFNIVGLAVWLLSGYFSKLIPGITALNSVLLGFFGYLILTYILDKANV
ncbi:MAG: hypothetical protein ACFFC7_31065, partial [Candidatus Hermodarchaeota archaeon]